MSSDDETDPHIPSFNVIPYKARHLIIYWGDTKEPLTFAERLAHWDAQRRIQTLHLSPGGILIRNTEARIIVVNAAGVPGTPPVPRRRRTDEET